MASSGLRAESSCQCDSKIFSLSFLYALCDIIREYLQEYIKEHLQARKTHNIGTILPMSGSFFTMNTAHIYETQKATLLMLKVAFHMLNDAEKFKPNKDIKKPFFIMVE